MADFEAEVGVSPVVTVRDDLGRFISLLDAAGEATISEIGDKGVAKAKEFAPRGHRRDKRTASIREGMFKLVGLNTVRWGSRARHTMPQETGSRPHDITGNVTFFWEKHWRMWNPGDNIIKHPGNPGVHFLQNSYDWVMSNWHSIAKKHYPN